MLKVKRIKYTPISNININRTMPNNRTSLTKPEFHPEYLERVQQKRQNIFSKFFRFVRALYYANIKYR